MYIDTITGLKIPGIYSLLTNKGDDDYNYLFEYINTLIYTNEEDSNNSKKTITVDFEVPLINNIKKHFKDFRMIGCFFHYKQALFRNAQKFKLTTKSKINQTLNLINNFLGLLPFKKVFNLSTFNICMSQIKKKFNNEYDEYLNYFVKEWQQYFLNHMLCYNLPEKQIRTNNIVENYNSQITKILGGKKILNWSEYINFLLDEENRYKMQLYNYNTKIITNSNKEIKDNKNNKKIINYIVDEIEEKKFWFKWRENSCRYDTFSLVLFLIYYNRIKENPNNSDQVNKLVEFCDNIKNISDKEKLLGFWLYIENNITKNYFNLVPDIKKYKILDVISGIFNLLDKNEVCCINYTLCYKCQKHLPLGDIKPEIFNPLISLYINELSEFINIEDILNDKFKYKKTACPNCDYKKDEIKDFSAEFLYTNIKLSQFLNFELIFNTLNDLSSFYGDIIKIFKSEVRIYKNIYSLKAVICMPTIDHYTVFLTNLKDNRLNLCIDHNYYYDGMLSNGIINMSNISLEDLIKNYNGIIFIYENKN